MESNYNEIKQFMQNYFKDFSAYAQDPRTTHRMDEFFAPDIEFIPYTAEALAPVSGRDNFLNIMTSHPSIKEWIEPEDIVIDEKRKIAVTLLKARLLDAKTEEILGEKHYFPLYELIEDQNNMLKIKRILFWEEVLPSGSPDFGEIFRRDPDMRKGFST